MKKEEYDCGSCRAKKHKQNLDTLDQELREYRDKNFDATVEAIGPNFRLYQDEARLIVTLLSSPSSICLNEREAKKVIEALMKHFGIAEVLEDLQGQGGKIFFRE